MSIATTTRHLTQMLPLELAEAGTILFKLTPSSTDVGPIVDTATEVFALKPSGVDLPAHNYVDAATELYKLTPSGVDVKVSVDVGTELFRFTPDADEHYCPQKVELEGDLESRWSASEESRWKASYESRWQGEFLGVGEGFAC